MASEINIAINQAKVVNSERSFALLRETGPKMCALTASQPGYLGYQAQYQIGALPRGGRFGGAELQVPGGPRGHYCRLAAATSLSTSSDVHSTWA